MRNKSDNDFAKSALRTYNAMIEHYEIVIKDLSGEIYDPELQKQKEPVLNFLKKMQAQWIECKKDFERRNLR